MLPIVSRSDASPETSCDIVVMTASTWSVRLLIVVSTELRLVMSSPITASFSARVEVRLPVLASRVSTEAPSPWNTAMMSELRALTSSGSSACSSGWKPLNSSVRSSAGAVSSRPNVCPGLRASPLRSGGSSEM